MAKGGLNESYFLGIDQILALAPETRIFIDAKDDIKIPWRAAMNAGLALAAHPQTRASIHAGRNAHHDLPLIGNNALPLASGTGTADNLAGAMTGRTGHGNLKKALIAANLAAAPALATSFDLAPLCSPAAITFGARYVFGQPEADFIPMRGLIESDIEIIAQVRARLRAATVCPLGESKKIPENIAEVGKNVFRAAKVGIASRALHAGMTKLVVADPLVRVAQDFVSFGRFLESQFGLTVAWIAVWMVTHGHLAIGMLYFVCVCRAAYAKDFVIIPLGHGLYFSGFGLMKNLSHFKQCMKRLEDVFISA